MAAHLGVPLGGGERACTGLHRSSGNRAALAAITRNTGSCRTSLCTAIYTLSLDRYSPPVVEIVAKVPTSGIPARNVGRRFRNGHLLFGQVVYFVSN